MPQKQTMSKKSIPARILRPGAETKVGGSPLTTIGFKALWWLFLSKTKEEEEEGKEEREVSVGLRG